VFYDAVLLLLFIIHDAISLDQGYQRFMQFPHHTIAFSLYNPG